MTAERRRTGASARGLEVTPPEALVEGSPILLRGYGWPSRPLHISIGDTPTQLERILQGAPVPGGVRPGGDGAFVVRLSTHALNAGRHVIRVRSKDADVADVTVTLEKRPAPGREDTSGDRGLSYWRSRAAFARRFGHIGYVPAGVRTTQVLAIAKLRDPRYPWRDGWPGGGIFFSPPVHGGCSWTPLGPAPLTSGAPGIRPANSGRVRSIAVDPITTSRIYLGTANGGVWKSTDSGATWAPKTDDQPSLAIGALAVDPVNPNRVFAGTGEYSTGDPFGLYYGLGLLYSSDFGETWTQLAAATFERVEISRILFDPNNAATHMFLACDTGVYESTNGGTSWTLLRAGSASDLVLRVLGGMPPSLQLLGAFYGDGLYTSTLTGGVWSAWTKIVSGAFPMTFGRIALGQSRNQPANIWAAFSVIGGSSPFAGIAKSADGGGTWTTVGLPSGIVYGTFYSMFVAVHPDTPTTVFLGANRLFRTDTGDAPWTEVTGGGTVLHMDHHALAFDPGNANVMYECNDGGVFRTSNGGTSWSQRNGGVASMQLYHFSHYPASPAMLIAGTQDNGGAFYSGSPVWQLDEWGSATHNEMGGDVVVTAIDPQLPSRRYYGSYGVIYRSDDSGRTWNAQHTLGAAEWNFPFILDPGNSGVCYVGETTLKRSIDAAATFSSITPTLNGTMTTIALHPANPDVLCVGTSTGHVYRVQRTGIDWTLPNVTTTDLTAAPLPPNLYISSVAMDTAGTIWVSFSSILMTEATGEFTNDHVYRLPGGAMTWEDRSAGLAQANPINTIVVDPANNNVVFCGGDASVFRWNSAMSNWQLWDEGLPNAAVFHLDVHAGARLLRAATYGRGMWERSIDAVACPDVDIYMRDHILDGARGPAPNNIAHPFTGGVVWWWMSEDVKVDAPPFQTPMPVTDPIDLANLVQHRSPRRGMTNRFYAQVHNRGPFTATSVRLRAFFANASLGLPNLPGDFWLGLKPFDADPSAVDWTPIGPTQPAGDLRPGETALVRWDWIVPLGAAGHSCLLVLATCVEDPLGALGVFDVGTLVTGQNNVVLKNLAVV